jgi:hypothetical protein
MTLTDMLTILAILIGPIAAVQLTRYLDQQREVRERKMRIFKALMSTRASTLSPAHVEALNQIDLEFDLNNRKEREVIEAWRIYLDHLNSADMNPDQWAIRRVDLLVELLHKMATVLNFQFDKVHIKNSSYFPRGYGELEDDQHAIRRGLKRLLGGDLAIPMRIVGGPSEGPTQTTLSEGPAPQLLGTGDRVR